MTHSTLVFFMLQSLVFADFVVDLKVPANVPSNHPVRCNNHVRKGDRVRIVGSGDIYLGKKAPSVPITGTTVYVKLKYNRPHGTVIVLFENSVYDLRSGETTFIADRNGFLRFHVNDNDFGDNKREFILKIIVDRPPPAPPEPKKPDHDWWDPITGAAKKVGKAAVKAGEAVSDAGKVAGKAVGGAAAEAGKAVGGAASEAGKAVGSAAVETGKVVGKGAVEVGKGALEVGAGLAIVSGKILSSLVTVNGGILFPPPALPTEPGSLLTKDDKQDGEQEEKKNEENQKQDEDPYKWVYKGVTPSGTEQNQYIQKDGPSRTDFEFKKGSTITIPLPTQLPKEQSPDSSGSPPLSGFPGPYRPGSPMPIFETPGMPKILFPPGQQKPVLPLIPNPPLVPEQKKGSGNPPGKQSPPKPANAPPIPPDTKRNNDTNEPNELEEEYEDRAKEILDEYNETVRYLDARTALVCTAACATFIIPDVGPTACAIGCTVAVIQRSIDMDRANRKSAQENKKNWDKYYRRKYETLNPGKFSTWIDAPPF